jgi:hypothetical protein
MFLVCLLGLENLLMEAHPGTRGLCTSDVGISLSQVYKAITDVSESIAFVSLLKYSPNRISAMLVMSAIFFSRALVAPSLVNVCSFANLRLF